MEDFTISREELGDLSGKVVVITGGSSGIGFSTASLLLELGASVVVGDLNPLPDLTTQRGPRLTHVTTDITDWDSIKSLFNAAVAQHKKIDHVFCAAGIPGFRADYMTETFDPESGELQEPSTTTFDINLRGTINTAYLGLYHMRHQSPAEGSIVLASSATAFMQVRCVDYMVSKHGILGFMRGMVPLLSEEPGNIRINCISPSWTRTPILDALSPERVGYGRLMQDAEAVARSAILLMADGKRHGQNIYSRQGKFWEVDDAFMKVADSVADDVGLDTVVKAIIKYRTEQAALGSDKTGGEQESKTAD